MEHSNVKLTDLPDEIIVTIFNKLHNAEVLYSLMGVNKRFNHILHDPIFTTKIVLMTATDHTCTLPDTLLDRFCFQILPKIHHKIRWFSLESASMERILLATHYPNLRQLDIFIITKEPELNFNDESSLVSIFQNQIVTLSVSGIPGDHDRDSMIKRADFLSHIMTIFRNVHHLKFYQYSDYLTPVVLFHNESSTFSSTLQELHISVYFFHDCLHLLDGRLNQLRTLYINVFHILQLGSAISNKEKLLNLKCFSLTCRNETFFYDEVLIPHLHRMTNLEKLALYVSVEYEENIINGNSLKKDIINHMPRLHEFIFNIRSMVSLDNQIRLLPNEDIQRTLTNCTNHQVISYVDYFPTKKKGQCHIYTYPHTMIFYDNITNNFPGGLFKYVKDVTLFDERPFEHTFFIRIAQAFPFLRDLTVDNWEPQNHKQDRNLSRIEYPYLTRLDLCDVHDDYAEQFLLDTKTCLSDSIWLMINYDTLQRVTHNFTRDATRINCAKIKSIHMLNRSAFPSHFNAYFPHLK